MTQHDFDQRFERISKIGFGLMAAGIIFAVVVGLPSFAIFDKIWPFLCSMGVLITGALILLADFTHYIFCNPRWKR